MHNICKFTCLQCRLNMQKLSRRVSSELTMDYHYSRIDKHQLNQRQVMLTSLNQRSTLLYEYTQMTDRYKLRSSVVVTSCSAAAECHFALKMEVARFFDTLVSSRNTMRRHNTEDFDSNLQS